MKSFILYFYILLNLFSCLINPAFAEIILPADIVEGQDSSKSWIKNSHFEKNVNSVSSYADAAGTSPVDGTGGSATMTCTRTTSSPISGDGSLLITKDAANRQGQGCSIPFNIDRGDRATMQTIVLPYEVASGTFTAGTDTTNSDLVMWVYDVTNSSLIPVQGTGRFYSNTADYFFGYFQTNSNSTSYRLIFHQALTGTSAYTLKVDNVKIFKSKFSAGTTVTDWAEYIPTFTGLGTPTISLARWRRVGQNSEIDIRATSGTVTGSNATFTLPSGQTVDYSGATSIVGFAATQSTTYPNPSVIWENGNATNILSLANGNAAASGFTQLTGTNVGNTTILSLKASVKISGWASSTQQSDGYDGRFIGMRYTNSAGTAIGTSAAVLPYPTLVYDSTSSYNTSTGLYTCPATRYYNVQASFTTAGVSLTTTQGVDLYIRLNGTDVDRRLVLGNGASANYNANLPTTVYCQAGQTIGVYAVSSVATTTVTLANLNVLSIEAVQAPTTISATELIAAGYSLSANKTPAANAALDFDTKLYDTHNAVTTGGSGVWKFTAPAPGIYEMCVNAALSSGNQTLDMYKNGVQGKVLMSVSTTVTSGCASVSLVAGEYISANPDGSVTFTATKNTNIYIKRLK